MGDVPDVSVADSVLQSSAEGVATAARGSLAACDARAGLMQSEVCPGRWVLQGDDRNQWGMLVPLIFSFLFIFCFFFDSWRSLVCLLQDSSWHTATIILNNEHCRI